MRSIKALRYQAADVWMGLPVTSGRVGLAYDLNGLRPNRVTVNSGVESVDAGDRRLADRGDQVRRNHDSNDRRIAVEFGERGAVRVRIREPETLPRSELPDTA